MSYDIIGLTPSHIAENRGIRFRLNSGYGKNVKEYTIFKAPQPSIVYPCVQVMVFVEEFPDDTPLGYRDEIITTTIAWGEAGNGKRWPVPVRFHTEKPNVVPFRKHEPIPDWVKDVLRHYMLEIDKALRQYGRDAKIIHNLL